MKDLAWEKGCRGRMNKVGGWDGKGRVEVKNIELTKKKGDSIGVKSRPQWVINWKAQDIPRPY